METLDTSDAKLEPGEDRPAYRNDTDEGPRLNRRVEFKVLSRQRSLCLL